MQNPSESGLSRLCTELSAIEDKIEHIYLYNKNPQNLFSFSLRLGRSTLSFILTKLLIIEKNLRS